MMIATKHPKKSPSPLTLSYTITFASFLLIIAFQSLALNRARAPSTTHQNELTYHPLKDPRVPPYTLPNKTWFMSTLTGRPTTDGMPEHFVFPSPPHNQLLCIDPRRRAYVLTAAGFPAGAAVVGGLTFVADSFYDYENPWHGLNALAGFFSWMAGNACARPARFVLFKNGGAVGRVGRWVAGVLKAGLGGEEPKIESLESTHGTTSVACFEKAVVFRRGLGGMSTERRHRLFDMVRCKAWALCNVDGEVERKGLVRVTLIGREGKRAFKNESEVKAVMERECGKCRGCSLKVVHLDNMSFCEQVCT